MVRCGTGHADPHNITRAWHLSARRNREMHKTVPKDPLFGKSNEQDYMEEMLDDHYADVMAKSGQFGIAKQMEAQMHAAKHPLDFKSAPLKPLSATKRTH